jgi:hypothetical protein
VKWIVGPGLVAVTDSDRYVQFDTNGLKATPIYLSFLSGFLCRHWLLQRIS